MGQNLSLRPQLDLINQESQHENIDSEKKQSLLVALGELHEKLKQVEESQKTLVIDELRKDKQVRSMRLRIHAKDRRIIHAVTALRGSFVPFNDVSVIDNIMYARCYFAEPLDRNFPDYEFHALLNEKGFIHSIVEIINHDTAIDQVGELSSFILLGF